ncbi:MAG: hypothetical protein ABI472_22825 [Ginsengibacter sp.]
MHLFSLAIMINNKKGPGIGVFTIFKKDLEYFIKTVRKKSSIHVLITPMQRRSFDSSGKIMETSGDYSAAIRQTAEEDNTPLIDLNALSKIMYEAWGPAESMLPQNSYQGIPRIFILPGRISIHHFIGRGTFQLLR